MHSVRADEAGAELDARPRPFRDSRRSASPRPMPPATNTGTSAASGGRISCASTQVETGPIWPPASIPSITSASTPERISFLASASAGAKQISLAPSPLIRSIAPAGGRPPARTTWLTPCRAQTSISSISMRVHGDQVDAERLRRCASWSRRSRCRADRASSPRRRSPRTPPALDIAETRLRSETQLIAPPRIGDLAAEELGAARHQPARGGRGRSRARSSRSASSASSPIGGVQHAHRELGIFLVDQHRDLDLGGGDREDVDAAVGQRLEHLSRRCRHGCACRRRRR